MINRRITASSWPKHLVLDDSKKPVSHGREHASAALTTSPKHGKPAPRQGVRYARAHARPASNGLHLIQLGPGTRDFRQNIGGLSSPDERFRLTVMLLHVL